MGVIKNPLTVITNMKHPIIVCDENMYIQFVNPAAERLLGKNASTLEGTHFTEACRTGPAPDEFTPLYDEDSTLAGYIIELKNTRYSSPTSRFQLLLKAIPDPIITLDLEGRITGFYGRWDYDTQILQNGKELQLKLILGKTHRDILGEDDAANHEKAIAQALLGETAFCEWKMKTPEGFRYYLTSYSPVMDHDGNISELIGIGRDITKQEERKLQLEAEEQRFHSVINSLDEYIWEVDLQGNFIYVSDRAEHILGLPKEELIGRDSTAGVEPAELEKFRTAVREAVKNKEPFSDVEIIRNNPSGRCWLSLSGIPVFDEDNRVVAYRGATLDITKQKQMEATLRDSEENYRSIITSMAEGVIVTDREGVIIKANPTAEHILGFSFDEIQGCSCFDPSWEMYLDDNTPVTRENHPAMVTLHSRSACRNVVMRKNSLTGEPLWIQHNSEPLFRLGSDKPYAVVSTFSDISARRNMEEELKKAQQNAIEASRAKSDFLAMMSHEIRTPMNGIMGMSTLLLDTALNRQQREYAQVINDSSEVLLNVLNDILDYSKVEAGKLVLESLDFHLPGVIYNVTTLFQQKALEKGIRLTSFIAPEVEDWVKGDPTRLQQVLTNLVSNAVKFTHSGQVKVHLRKETSDRHQSRLRFEVTDTGIGIEKAMMEQIFHPFHQADSSTSRKFGGTGLGLAITGQLVKLMGGNIGAISEPGKGSTFWFSIPFQPPKTQVFIPKVEGHSPPEKTDFPLWNIPLPVLLVEDNPVNQQLAVTILTKMGLMVHRANNGLEAVKAAAETEYAIIFMDCQMPEMDGFEATKIIRNQQAQSGRHVPIIAMTALAMSGDRERCLNAGMDDYLSKPVLMEHLIALLDKWLPYEKSTLVQPPSNFQTDEFPSASAGTDPCSVIDLTVLKNILAMGDDDHFEFLTLLLQTYLEDAQQLMLTLQQAVTLRDPAGIHKTCHALKSSSASIGAKELASLCAHVEQLGRTGNLENMELFFTQMKAKYTETVSLLNQLIEYPDTLQ
ncbi:PAS domain S-box protein [Heliobacterium chlorum]|uniref:Stage 0 sporulation protein A homolog n=1 Tax=Heliobacterium chlorum TaxID=2698 RepID=A0ABR7SZD6_HELCL|nr:PAS domain S-box protein [Heliobacterium chlorum]MBC9783796.1 PAS domain S-box protein [Heliobacterium chlorum]